MRGFLIDTQIFVWGALDLGRLSPEASRIIRGERVYVSAASLWEIETKRQIGKLTLDLDLAAHLQAHAFQELPITWEHAQRVAALPLIHRDPFDRLLVSQALLERLPILSADAQISRYPVEVVWQ